MRKTLILLLLCGLAPNAVAADITVSAAISLKAPLTELAVAYKTATADTVHLNLGASGLLMAQIQQGAPVDLFISAGADQMTALTKAGKVDPAEIKTIALNSLVLIIPAKSDLALKGIDQLRNDHVKRIAMGEPKSVPAGQYALESLTNLKLYDALKARLIYGGNVQQVFDYVQRGEVDAGFVYTTDVTDAVRVIATVDESAHSPIQYPAALIRGAANRAGAATFLTYIQSAAGTAILQKHRFAIPSAQPATAPAREN